MKKIIYFICLVIIGIMFLTSLLKHADAQVERQNRPISITAVTGASDATYVIVLYDNGKMEGFGWNDKRIQWK